ncbi:amino acid adenylation domain-containing protein [Micromonospora echinofusca]|uniref:amino acid adenylation domain-containing protein n=1 Tax=Micromonospora echinofusca TaxID=47858 RepID=UPI003F7765A1
MLSAAATGDGSPVRPVAHDRPLPLSFAQQRLWFLDRMTPHATDYLVPVALRLRGPLDPDALLAALAGTVQRHAVLRTRYAERDGEPVQVVDPDATVPVDRPDLTTLPAARREAELTRLVADDLRRPFDLTTGVPARATLARLAADDHLFLLTLHHIVSDGWSAGLLADELARHYTAHRTGQQPPAPPEVQYADYAVWQRQHADSPAAAERLAHWCDRLADLPTLELPTDRRRPAVRDQRGDRLAVDLPAEVGRAVDDLARRHRATPFMVLLAAWYAVLARWTGQTDLAVGTPVAGRNRPETERLIGFFANTVVLRADLTGRPGFGDLVDRVRDVALDAYAHADVPFERVVEELAPERDPSRNPLFQVLVELHHPQSAGFALPEVTVEPVDVSWPVAKFDLMLSVRRRADGALRCGLEYATALFDRETVARLAGHYRNLLTAALADPAQPVDRLDLFDPDERRKLTTGWQDVAVAPPGGCLPELIAAQAVRTPDAVAVVAASEQVSYADLAGRVRRLAHHLRAAGVRAETPVAVLLRRDAGLVVALLAVHAAGGVHVPIDPDHPHGRRAYVLADSGATVLVSTSDVLTGPPGADVRVVLLDTEADVVAGRPDGPLPAVDPDGAAYIVHTSGSTGRPKGVVISHAAIRNRVLWTVREHGLGPGDRVLQKTTVGFDAAMWEFLAPLTCGATVVVAADGVPRDPAAMVRAVAAHRITVLQVVPSVLRLLVEQPDLATCTALRLVCCAGEPLPVALCDRLLARVPVQLVNTYGPTECAIDVTAWRYTGNEPGEIVAIGQPLDNTRILVLDAEDRLAPIGVAGELCVAGVGLGRGYVGRGDLTAERFVPHPYPQEPGERLYRTGDRVRRRADGCLEYLGRLDRQVKLNGVRIEPAEIEAALTEHPQVQAAVVDVYRDDHGEQRLVAHVVPVAGAGVDEAALRDHLDRRLPGSMVPSVLRPLAGLPLTASGKVDRAALPGLRGLDTAPAAHLAPRTPAEAAVARVFADVLGRDRVGADDDFFALGGHSLLATRLVFRLGSAVGIEVPVAEVFARRTVARIAELLTADGPGRPDPVGPVVPVPRTGPLPTTSAQRRMWFLDQLEPGSSEYLVPLVRRLSGPLGPAALLGAVDDLVARHEVLRTRYLAEDGTPVQVVDPPAPLGIRPVDLTGLPPEHAEARARELVREQTSVPFALDRQWPLRVLLVRTAPDTHLFALVAHHVAVDAWSLDVLNRELGMLYRTRTVGARPPAPPPVQYADVAAWQDRWSAGPGCRADLAYWRDRLTGLTPLELPTDRPRPATRDPRGDLLPLVVPDDLAAAVTALARRHGVTPFVVLLAVFTTLLSRYTGQTDVAVGTPVAGRTRPEVEDVVGLFINTVVLRADLSGDPTFTGLLDRLRQDVVDAYSHQELPFERLVDDLQPERDPSRNPLFQVMFELQPAPAEPLRLDGVTTERVPAPWRTAKFDLTLSLARRADGSLHGLFEYATALFDRATVDRMAGHYLELLRAVTDRPTVPLRELDLLTTAERRQLVRDWNAVPAEEPAGCVPELFQRRVAAHPDAVAVTFGADRLSYRQLNARANRLARHLRASGVGPETVVAVCLERGPDAVVALLAVLKAGGTYVPVDPEHPVHRLAFMIDDATARLVVTTDRFADRLAGVGCPLVRLDGDADRIAGRSAEDPAPSVGPDNLAYMIYTSGSTGQPKGVLIGHRSYAQHCAVIARSYDITPGDRVVLLSALTFDVAMDQIAATLLAGATIVVADPLFWSPAELPDRVAEHGITIMEITPAYYREVMHHVRPGDARLRGLRLMNVGSDVVTVDDARRWAATGLPGRFLVNYGPTEATVTCLLHPVTGDLPGERVEAALPIGRPVPGTRAYVLDGAGRPVPVGVPGELHLGGVRLARGYHRRAALTAEKFVPDPFGTEPGGRLYRTGDLVRYLPDGSVEFLGRIDQQVKLRGFRIELGEIEAVLAGHPSVRAVAVVARDLHPGDRRLVAYLVGHDDDSPPDVPALRLLAADRLPDYMCPSVWMLLPELPLTPSRKVDRRALPAPQVDRSELERSYLAPRNDTEEIIAGLWAELLGVDKVGVHDDVFLLGAHSLLVTRVLARICAVFAVDVPLRRLFEATTVAALADVVHAAVADEIAQLSDDEVDALLAQPDRR